MSQICADRRCLVRGRASASRGESGQAALMMLAVVGVVLACAAVLFAFGNALGAKGRHQRAADLAAISAAQVMRDLYPRLFEPPFIEPDVPNARHLEEAEYRALAVAAAIRGGRRNGVEIRAGDVAFSGSGFAPTRVTVRVRGETSVRLPGEPRHRAHARVPSVGLARVRGGSGRDALARVPIRARATAELLPDAGGGGLPGHASGGGYDGPLAYRQGKPMTSRSRSTGSPPRRATRRDSSSASRAAFAPTPSRHGCLPPTPTRSGSRRPARACIATPPSLISARQPPMPGSLPTPSASASSRDTAGKLGTRGCD
jgi:hypothetical protein